VLLLASGALASPKVNYCTDANGTQFPLPPGETECAATASQSSGGGTNGTQQSQASGGEILATSQPQDGGLPFTGLDIALVVGGAVVLIGLGVGMRRMTRERPTP
jgi:hypothetical protein